MFGLFKKSKKEKDLLRNWQIPIDQTFTRINNGGSIQYVNNDESRVLYFSVLVVSGKTSIAGDAFKKMAPGISETAHGWQLKGAKDEGTEILVCVFSFTDKNDEQWAKGFFSAIAYSGKG